jgi:RNA polymerase sigma-70 factor (ECF subfamily)
MTEKQTKRMRSAGGIPGKIDARMAIISPNQLPVNLREVDQDQFAELTESHRRELRAHCYRMLGSIHEAEEMVQETFWRAWSRRDTFEGRSTLRAWLYKIATNQCIDAIRQRPRRALPVSREAASTLEQPIPASINEPIWLEPYPVDLLAPPESNPEARYSLNESIRLAFLTSLHLLPPRQRAVLILRDVLGWQSNEVADALGQTVSSVKSALHRARATLAAHYPTFQRDQIAVHIGDEELNRLLDRYMQAWEAADVDGLVALLRDDSAFSMPPIPSWYRGRQDIARLVSKTIFSGQAAGRWRLAPTRANDQPAFGLYRWNEEAGAYAGYGVQALTIIGDRILDITTFRDPTLLAFFDLPSTLPA